LKQEGAEKFHGDKMAAAHRLSGCASVSVDFQQLNGLYHLLKTSLNPER
jgi:hypothetical protein